jgi:glycosyltransferase involved in cell wall biosynthesis
LSIVGPYVIITPAFNEDSYIEKTIKSVLRQTLLPVRWVIVDDGSTDETGKVIKKYAKKHSFIHYHYRRKPEGGWDYYASNVLAIKEGYEIVIKSAVPIEFVAILDADIQLPDYYYKNMINIFNADSQLGVASGVYENLIDGRLHAVLHDRHSTPKAIQIFRKRVYESIGGFLPLKYGGEDTIACVMARMDGWKVWSYPNIKVVHLRPTGTGAVKNILSVRFRQGICERNLATHPLFFFLKALRRSFLEKPYIIGGLTRLIGYIWASVRRDEVSIPQNVAKFLRREQLSRVWSRNRRD